MKRYAVWCVCLIAWLIGCARNAQAEDKYTTLCAESEVNQADVVAWIEISRTGLYWPVMQHNEDDSFYASHDESGAKSEFGALYTQAAYNAADFSDSVTVIYGSSKAEGAPFRDLQEIYSGSFEECRSILLHLPEETLEYEVFAALPYTSIHILHYYDFDTMRRYDAFFDGVYSTRLLGVHLDEANRPDFGDRIVILSTGLRGDMMQRYLVMAKLVHE